MPGILWVGNPYFSRQLEPLGWQVTHRNPPRPRTFTWEQLVEINNGAPDVLVLGDNSMPPLFLGLERYPCLTVFFCVDSHIHSWQPQYAQAFDLCCLNLKDNLPAFAQRLQGERLRWLPLYADAGSAPPAVPEQDKEYDFLFVGNVHPDIHPGRHAFFRELSKACPGFTVLRGNYHQLFPKGRVIFNFAERGDLNFRVFQALGTGACLLTPRVGHGMLELFREGEELFCYDPADLNGLVRTVDGLLADPELRQRTGRQGLAAVDAGHRAPHRARTFSQWVLTWDRQALIHERLLRAKEIHRIWLRLLYLHCAATLPPPLKGPYLEYAKESRS